ncbi:hypothetical protein F4818DRAFT_445512 [Hypoxylon cercidicola]|nr:hypothetical protein F4818DRAFT_445512 [Hypoxylon cercidicola]
MAPLGNNSMVPHMVNFMVANSIICFLALTVVGLRIYSRFTTKAGLGWDDGFILASMAAGLALLFVEGLLCTSGIGHQIQEVGDSTLPLISLIMANNVLFIIATIAYKLSILLFYLRIFVSNTKTRIATYTSMVFFVGWGVACLIQLFALCRPDTSDITKQTCDRNAVMRNTSALCIFGDLVVLGLPIPATWNLYMSRRNKIKITFLFLLGFVVTVIAIIRYVSIVHQDIDSVEFALALQNPLAYAVLESNMGILCASLPMVHALLSDWKTKLLDKVIPLSKLQSNSSHLEGEQADWNDPNSFGIPADPRYGYTVSITAG